MSHRGMPVTKAIRARRRKVAEEMKAEYDKLTTQQKLDKLPPAPAAAKQRARLESQLNREQEGRTAKVSPGSDIGGGGGTAPTKPKRSRKDQ